MMDEVIRVEQLARDYRGRPALADVSFALARGVVLGLLGANGAGKTTCLQILSGNLAPSAGRVTILGQDLLRAPLAARRHIGYLPERPPLHLDMRVDEYLTYCARLRRMPRAAVAPALARVKRRCGLEGVGGRLLGRLSKGYRQRTGLAQAILHEPALVLLDEPTDGLDPVQIREVRDLIRDLGANHTLVLSSHQLPEVQAVCDQVLILKQGRVVHAGRLGDTAPDGRWYRVGVAPDPGGSALEPLPAVACAELDPAGGYRVRLQTGVEPAELVRQIVGAGWGLHELTPERTDLEQVFLASMGREAGDQA
ncbi:ABC transporter ATP-binding protein [Thioalkalicoccus limnaeus]|uniref:ABC transporter ATP-binding protein n=1 Tax=Thioalkalicoccus limnaeus TaxID=120681 RepID=A0ABV4BBN3_9GAMM